MSLSDVYARQQHRLLDEFTREEQALLKKLEVAAQLQPEELRTPVQLYILMKHGETCAGIIRKLTADFSDAIRAALEEPSIHHRPGQ